jgi:hypothetical protein
MELQAPARTDREGFPRISVVSNAGGSCRGFNSADFKIRVEGANESNCLLGLSGVTINVPSIRSRESFLDTQISMRSFGCSEPFMHGPGDLILGFRDDGSFGEMAAKCLKMECVREQWPPHERIALEASLSVPLLLKPYVGSAELDLQVRVWSTKPDTGEGFGDPDWKTTEQRSLLGLIEKDQQGIPAYRVYLQWGDPYE